MIDQTDDYLVRTPVQHDGILHPPTTAETSSLISLTPDQAARLLSIGAVSGPVIVDTDAIGPERLAILVEIIRDLDPANPAHYTKGRGKQPGKPRPEAIAAQGEMDQVTVAERDQAWELFQAGD